MEDHSVTIADEPMAVRPMTSYNDVMGYLHRIHISPEVKRSVGQRLLIEVNGEYLSKAFARLDHLSQLQEGWDGEGGRKISYDVIENLRDVLLVSDNEDWKYWMLSPAPNGSLGLQSKRHVASMSVGDEEFSYYSCRDHAEDWGNHVKFTPVAFLEIMRRIV